jgi:hypothetical protein
VFTFGARQVSTKLSAAKPNTVIFRGTPLFVVQKLCAPRILSALNVSTNWLAIFSNRGSCEAWVVTTTRAGAVPSIAVGHANQEMAKKTRPPPVSLSFGSLL